MLLGQSLRYEKFCLHRRRKSYGVLEQFAAHNSKFFESNHHLFLAHIVGNLTSLKKATAIQNLN